MKLPLFLSDLWRACAKECRRYLLTHVHVGPTRPGYMHAYATDGYVLVEGHWPEKSTCETAVPSHLWKEAFVKAGKRGYLAAPELEAVARGGPTLTTARQAVLKDWDIPTNYLDLPYAVVGEHWSQRGPAVWLDLNSLMVIVRTLAETGAERVRLEIPPLDSPPSDTRSVVRLWIGGDPEDAPNESCCLVGVLRALEPRADEQRAYDAAVLRWEEQHETVNA